MNKKEVKVWLAIGLTLCYVLLTVPVMWSSIGIMGFKGGEGETTDYVLALRTIVMSSMFLLLILMIYSDEIISRLDKTRIGKWIFAPLGEYKK